MNCSIFYGRSGNASIEKMKQIFDSGEIGHLALYKEDWFHHYPTWNPLATDLEVFDPGGNDRVHYGIQHLISSEALYVAEDEQDGKPIFQTVKKKDVLSWEVEPFPHTRYDNFVLQVQNNDPLDSPVSEALIDMQIMDLALHQ